MSGNRRRRRSPPRTHLPVEDRNAPGCCTCGIPLAAQNERHDLKPTDPAVKAAEARRLGEDDS
jgi:hypothetical protein